MKLCHLFIVLAFSAVLVNSSQKIAFGSCSQFYRNHPLGIYEQIAKEGASDFIFLGDMLYLDRYVFPGPPTIWHPLTDKQTLSALVRGFLTSQQLMRLRSVSRLHYVWDDHDYNCNNCGSDNPMKATMLQLFRREMNLSLPLEECLHQHTRLSEKVSLVLLDVRSHRTPKETLSQRDWEWLQALFRNTSQQELLLIGSGIQVIYDDRPVTEKWASTSRLRLFQLLHKYGRHAILLSGDVHFAEIGRRQGISELTSSGLTFYIGDQLPLAEQIIATFLPGRYSRAADRYAGANYGLVQVNYNSEQNIETIDLMIRGQDGSTQLWRRVLFSQTQIEELDQLELRQDHMDELYSHVLRQLAANPLRLLYLLPMQWPLLVGACMIRQLLRWRIE